MLLDSVKFLPAKGFSVLDLSTGGADGAMGEGGSGSSNSNSDITNSSVNGASSGNGGGGKSWFVEADGLLQVRDPVTPARRHTD
jgi:hypothetical protein